jgi:hypothetical protein
MLTDSAGRQVDCRATIGALRAFERRTGIKLFATLAQAGVDKSSPLRVLLPGISEVLALLYECAPERERGTYEEFCARFGPQSVRELYAEAVRCMMEFFPAPSATPDEDRHTDPTIASDADAGGGENG